MAIAPELMYDEMAVALSYGLLMATIATGGAPPAAAAAPAPAAAAAPAKGKKDKKKEKKAPPPKKEEEDDDEEFDFGDEEEEEEAATPANDRKAKAAALKAKRDAETEEKKQLAMERLAKKEAKQRSLCNLEVKPWEEEQDLMELFAKIKSTVVKPGLAWGENCSLKPVAYGIKKICMTAVINMDISMDEVIEEILEDVFPDEIQSMEMLNMSLL